MIFRWSIWGKKILEDIEILRYSILSFKKQFGDDQQYIVYTDNFDLVLDKIGDIADVRSYLSKNNPEFYVYSKATWLKWCPSSRLDINQTEFQIDSDVFLLRYPKELDLFISDEKKKFAIMDEFLGQAYQHGAMRRKASINTPFVNAGFFVQKAGCDISTELIGEFN